MTRTLESHPNDRTNRSVGRLIARPTDSVRRGGVLLLVAAAILVAPLRADIIVYQEGAADPFTGLTYTGTDDALVQVFAGDRNFGGENNIQLGSQGGAIFNRRSLIRFDVSSLAGQFAQINCATLRLTVAGVGTFRTNEALLLELLPANAGWIEGRGTLANPLALPGESTNSFRIFDTAAWQDASGSGTTLFGTGAQAAFDPTVISTGSILTVNQLDPVNPAVRFTDASWNPTEPAEVDPSAASNNLGQLPEVLLTAAVSRLAFSCGGSRRRLHRN